MWIHISVWTGIDPTLVFGFHEMVSKSRKEVMQNDTYLHEMCTSLDRTKTTAQPNAWAYVQCLSLPRDDEFNEFTSRGLYGELNRVIMWGRGSSMSYVCRFTHS